MAKNDNLKDFLADVADAIREKTGTTRLINPQDFSNEIASIETSKTMAVDAPLKDVNFYDCDGTRLYSYSWDEVLAMTELPPLPSRMGLTCQEWNYTLEDIKEQSHHKADVGAIYATDDGMTRLYINTLADDTEVSFKIQQSTGDVTNGSWGDGADIVHKGNTVDIAYSHTYAKSGAYVIRIGTSRDGSYLSSFGANKFASETLRKIETANWVNSIRYFNRQYNLESITLSKNANFLYSTNVPILGYSSSLKTLILPRGTSVKTEYASGMCTYAGLSIVSLPNEITFSPSNLFSLLAGNQGLRRIVLPQGIDSIGERMFKGCIVLSEVAIPNSVTSIGSAAFAGCDRLTKLDFSHFTAVPSLSTYPDSPFPSEWPTIIVPDALYDEWIAGSWKNYASNIVKASEA